VFTKGATLTYAITSENGTLSYSEVNVRSVDGKGNAYTIYAHDNRLDDQRRSTFSYRQHYYSDSLNWCVDALNHLNCPIVYSSNYITELESDSLVYPYAMKVGDTLRGAAASELMRGSVTNMRAIRFSSRKVTAAEPIGIGGEQLQAFRIECKVTSTTIADYGALGKIPTETAYDLTEWFVPSKGVVKKVIRSATGETTTVLQGTK
jgi:hypothetical protein